MITKVAAFDFDGTLTKKDTLIHFIKFCFGSKRLYQGLAFLSPTLLSFKLKIITNDNAKQKLFSYFFKGMTLACFNKLGSDYQNEIDKILRPDAYNKLQWHLRNKHEVLIVSASVENWIVPWAASKNIKTVLATQIETNNGALTGRFKSKNCYGIEKAKRLKDVLQNIDSYELYAYGDTRGDKEMLMLADYKFYRCF